MDTQTIISAIALVISIGSIALSLRVFLYDKHVKSVQLQSELLTKISALKIEYEKLLNQITTTYKKVNGAAPELAAQFESQIQLVENLLEQTSGHYNRLLFGKRTSFHANELLQMQHHCDSLLMRTEQDRRNYDALNSQIDNAIKGVK